MPAPTRVLRASWSSTLCLPKSTFPPRPVAADRPKYLKRCTGDLYAWQRSAPEFSGKPPFVLHDGPPYANGSLHIGHALNKILKDIILRVQLAQGRRVEYVPGWDCHGLPIELKALQQHAERSGKALEQGKEQCRDAVEIRRLARSLALKTVDEQRKTFREWAILGDWERPYKTMDKDFELRQLEIFRQMLAKGLIYRKYKPVYWSPSTGTALAEAELEYKDDHVSHSAFVAFEVLGETAHQSFGLDPAHDKISLLIWTTTPWTLPANKAIAVHEDIDYVCVKFPDRGHVIVAQSRLEEIEKLCGILHDGQVLGPVKGSQIVGCHYKNDAFASERTGPVLAAEYVSADSGTGLVHTAPGHGMDDYLLCLKHGIQPFAPVDDAGRFTKDAFTRSDSDGMSLTYQVVTEQGNKSVLQYLADSHPGIHGVQLIGRQKYKHKYPYDWRSKKPVIVRATAQWFADVGEIRDAALGQLNTVNFIPSTGKERLKSFVKNRSEWCISRQRAWGVPIPALYRKDTGEALLTPESVSHILSVIEERGIDAWWTDDANDETWVPEQERGHSYQRGKDTMDVWFDSGTSWTHMGRTDSGFEPETADVYLEGSDQHRGWFQSSLLTKIAYDAATGSKPKSPFKTLITHGFTLDEKGKKQSKSLGNVIAPDEIINGTLLPPLKRKGKKQDSMTYDALGPDALRLWVAGSDYTKDMNIGEKVLKAVNGSLSKLRVTFKLLTGLLHDFPHESYRRRLDDLAPVDVVALAQLSDLSGSVWEALRSHEHHKAALAIDQYINAKFSAFYMEAIKDRVYTGLPHGHARRDAQFVLWHVFEELCSLLRPLTPLLVEEARAHLSLDDLGHQSLMPHRLLHRDDLGEGAEKLQLRLGDASGRVGLVMRDMPLLNHIRTAVQRMQEQQRAQKKLGSSLQSQVILQALSTQTQELETLRALGQVWPEPHLADLFVVSGVNFDFEGSLLGSRIAGLNGRSISWHDSENLEPGLRVIVHEAIGAKCDRCWKYTAEKHASLCSRCEAVVGSHEQR